VAVTAHALPQDRDRALAAGCEDFITKPIDLKMLLRLTEKYLGPAS
jgi:CheY-like chemotaxis protein